MIRHAVVSAEDQSNLEDEHNSQSEEDIINFAQSNVNEVKESQSVHEDISSFNPVSLLIDYLPLKEVSHAMLKWFQ